MDIKVKRIYENPESGDGKRILVDRLWPRGMSKEKARIDLWIKDIAPSDDLRRWYQHDPEKWEAFQQRYARELKAIPEVVERLIVEIEEGSVTFVFSSKEEKLNNAWALKAYLEQL